MNLKNTTPKWISLRRIANDYDVTPRTARRWSERWGWRRRKINSRCVRFFADDIAASLKEREKEPRRKTIRPDLKEVLMHLGNALVLTHGFKPSHRVVLRPCEVPEEFTFLSLVSQGGLFEGDTSPLVLLSVWFNSSPEARAALKDLGYDWRMETEVAA